MRTPRQHTLDRATIKSLMDALGFLVPATALHDAISVKAGHLQPTVAEQAEAILNAERTGRISGLTTETGIKYSLTESGESWAIQNRL